MEIGFFYREGEKGNILIGIDFTESSGEAGGGGSAVCCHVQPWFYYLIVLKIRPEEITRDRFNREPTDFSLASACRGGGGGGGVNIGVMSLLVMK